MPVDPLLPLTLSLAFGVLFLSAACHKLRNVPRFQGILLDYQIMPGVLVPTAARLLIGAEFAVGMAWFAQLPVAAAVSAILLTGYTIAISINLSRGRTYITCGCGLTGHADETLTLGLIWRNGLLILALGACGLPTAPRSIGLADYAVAVIGLVVAMLLYVAASQLLANQAAIQTWRSIDG